VLIKGKTGMERERRRRPPQDHMILPGPGNQYDPRFSQGQEGGILAHHSLECSGCDQPAETQSVADAARGCALGNGRHVLAAAIVVFVAIRATWEGTSTFLASVRRPFSKEERPAGAALAASGRYRSAIDR